MSAPAQDQPAGQADSPGLPLFHSWPAVYAFVLLVFAILVLALTLFRDHFTGAAP